MARTPRSPERGPIDLDRVENQGTFRRSRAAAASQQSGIALPMCLPMPMPMLKSMPVRAMHFLAATLMLLAATAVGLAGGSPPVETDDPAPAPATGGPWAPLPPSGQVPPIFEPRDVPRDSELTARATVREYERQLRQIRYRHFHRKRSAELRAEGIRQLQEFTDPAAFAPMIEVFAKDEDEIRLAMLEHFARQGEAGQAALAFVAISIDDAALAHEAELRMTKPAGAMVLAVLDQALRSRKHSVANAAASLAGSLDLLEAIPLLIFAQATTTPTGEGETGDLAWIAIETQRAYVQAVTPVVGSGGAAFAPVIGVVSEGSVLRIQDAVVITYRTIVHQVLVTMTSRDWGESTAHLDYDIDGWWRWYNGVYVPFKNEQAKLAELSQDATAQSGEPQGDAATPAPP